MPPPWFPFYPGSWLSDPVLNGCGLEAKGLFIDMLALMWNDSRPPIWPDDDRQIATRLRCDIRVWKRIRKRLCDGPHSPLRVTNGQIYSPRLARLWQKVADGPGGYEKLPANFLETSGELPREVRAKNTSGELPPDFPGTSGELPPDFREKCAELPNGNSESAGHKLEGKKLEVEKGEAPLHPQPVDTMGNLAHQVRTLWNTYATVAGFPRFDHLDSRRSRAIERAARSGILTDQRQWAAFIARIVRSKYLSGDVEGKRYKSDFDWCLDRAGQILDGRYDDRATQTGAAVPSCDFPGGCDKPANLGGLCFGHYEAKADS